MFSFLKIFILIFISVFLFSSSYADNNKQKLKNVLKQITDVKTDITKKERKQKSVAEQLKKLKKKITALEKKLKETTKNIKKQQGVLRKLNKERAGYQKDLDSAQEKLSSQITSVYQAEPVNYFKIVFSEEKKTSQDLLLSYHRYIFKDRLEKMHNMNVTLERLNKNKAKIIKEKKWLERIKRKQAKQKKELEKTKKERDRMLGLLKVKIATQNKNLKKLLDAKKNLEKLITRLTVRKKKKKTTTKVSSELKARFCKDFVWPAKGKVVIHFGSPIENSSWKWNGVVIRGVRDRPIRAISDGTVVYADNLSGYGLLLIIDHGDGYMSLYGHNNSLSQGLNSRVKAGDIVANMGKRGDDKHELYFAIRYNGKPVDPEKWCK